MTAMVTIRSILTVTRYHTNRKKIMEEIQSNPKFFRAADIVVYMQKGLGVEGWIPDFEELIPAINKSSIPMYIDPASINYADYVGKWRYIYVEIVVGSEPESLRLYVDAILVPSIHQNKKEVAVNLSIEKKYPEFILAVDNQFFDNHPAFFKRLTEYSAEEWLSEVMSALVIREREHLDNVPSETTKVVAGVTVPEYKGDRRYRQILPYTIIRQRAADNRYQYHVYRRPSKGTGEARLAGNVSMGFGGHIDLVDVIIENSVIDLFATITVSVDREVLKEELKGATPEDQERMKEIKISFANEFILDDSNDVGRLHVGLIMLIDLPSDIKVICNEEELTGMKAMEGKELLESGEPLENWTRIYLEHHHGHELPSDEYGQTILDEQRALREGMGQDIGFQPTGEQLVPVPPMKNVWENAAEAIPKPVTQRVNITVGDEPSPMSMLKEGDLSYRNNLE